MQITLNQDEIEDAIRGFVLGHITIADDTHIAIDLKAGRGDNGFTATLDLNRASYGVAEDSPAVDNTTYPPEHDPNADVPIPTKKAVKPKKTDKVEKDSVSEEASTSDVEGFSEEEESKEAEEPSTSADSIPDAPDEEEKAEEKPAESPRKPSIFQFNAAKQPAE